MWKPVSFVRRGKLRTKVLDSLIIPNNPTDLAKKLNSHRPTVSQVISELKEKDLVKRLNPGEKNVSIYGLTVEGKKVVEKIAVKILPANNATIRISKGALSTKPVIPTVKTITWLKTTAIDS